MTFLYHHYSSHYRHYPKLVGHHCTRIKVAERLMEKDWSEKGDVREKAWDYKRKILISPTEDNEFLV